MQGNNYTYFWDWLPYIFANYIVTCKTSVKEREKLEQYKQLAFSAAQNGNMDILLRAVSTLHWHIDRTDNESTLHMR